MAIKGSLQEAALPDILQLLALGRKTGCLSVIDHQNFGHVYFREGRVVFASLVNREQRLGERLLGEGRIDEAELAAAVSQQKENPERRLGELLVERGALPVEELWKTVADQIEETVYTLFTWDEGYFSFEPGQEPPQTEILLSLDASALLLEGARRADEWARIREKLPHRRLILARAGQAPEAAGAVEPGDEAAVWEAIDGVRDVAGILAVSRIEELRGLIALYELVGAGRVAVVGESRAAAAATALRRRDEYRNLGVAFYNARMYSEAAREFGQMLALGEDDSEAHFHLGLVAFRRGKLGEACAEFGRSVELGPRQPAGLLNLALALEALGRMDEAAAVLESLLRRFPDCAPAKLSRAILHYDRGAYAEALALLEGLELDDRLSPVADFYRAMLHALFWDLRAARELLAAIPPARQSARILNNLGAVLERGDRLEEARLSYAAALEMGGTEAMARKNLGDLYYREGKYEQARRSYLLALQEDPAHAEALNRLGEIAFKEGRQAEAAAYRERAAQAAPARGREPAAPAPSAS
jgi:tetratricopeptide (TPR) repeat protein